MLTAVWREASAGEGEMAGALADASTASGSAASGEANSAPLAATAPVRRSAALSAAGNLS